jgi:hypothetical protein
MILTQYDKAGAGIVGAAATSVAVHFLGLEIGSAIGTLITGGLVWLARYE